MRVQVKEVVKKKRNAAELNFLLVINEALVTLGPIVHLRRFSGMKRRIEREEKIPSHFLLIILFRSFRTHTSHTPELVTDLLICGNNPELSLYIYIYTTCKRIDMKAVVDSGSSQLKSGSIKDLSGEIFSL